MDVYAELSARRRRPAHPTMAAPNISPTMRFPLAPTAPAPVPEPAEVSRTLTGLVPNSQSQETLSSPSSPPGANASASIGSSPTKTSSSSSSYEVPYTQYHPSNKPTAPLYRPAALRAPDHPAPPQPFPRRPSFAGKDAPPVKKDHWKVQFTHYNCD
jgi:hypothetical protein